MAGQMGRRWGPGHEHECKEDSGGTPYDSQLDFTPRLLDEAHRPCGRGCYPPYQLMSFSHTGVISSKHLGSQHPLCPIPTVFPFFLGSLANGKFSQEVMADLGSK